MQVGSVTFRHSDFVIDSSFWFRHSSFPSMSYIQNTSDDQRAMLEAIGVSSIEELFAQIPSDVRLLRDLDIPPALSELELLEHLTSLAEKNTAAGQKVCFLGGGCYDH